jgi:hypothetical protein
MILDLPAQPTAACPGYLITGILPKLKTSIKLMIPFSVDGSIKNVSSDVKQKWKKR